ncbi:putative esterase [Aquimarina sp. MAR_2010_214]|uniref:carboxylesterase family protein n=1 Tax=Aquimarina sp. MAR_2010_214 TaxID=1250026 RepID=UPI000C714EA0|nr:alpha/beta hydrolase-fold protein [Aquimarina sp. MAR_2010_214]PKV50287.1 putative esterase [Aquimarina sp. MAR_2010_214]
MEVLKITLFFIFIIKPISIIAQEKNEHFLIKTEYLVSLPNKYKNDVNQKFPVLIFLHGSRENSNLSKVKNDFLPLRFAKNRNLPLILVSPVNSYNKWSVDLLNKLLDDVIDKYNVDENRIYLSGHSLGAWGAWDWAQENPERFAAVAPISGCSRGDIKAPWKLRHLPIWVFHGENDENTNVNCNINTVKRINKYDGKTKITIYPDVGHDIWELPFAKNNLIEWLLYQSKTKNIPKRSQLDPNIYEKYTGRYTFVDNIKDTIQVIYMNNKLHLKLQDKNPISLSSESKTKFYVDPEPWAGIEFVIEDNLVIGLKLLEHKLKTYSKLNRHH